MRCLMKMFGSCSTQGVTWIVVDGWLAALPPNQGNLI
jgi:hypothetical protein